MSSIIFDRKTDRVFTADRGSQHVTAIVTRTGKVAGTIEGLGGRTEHLAPDDAGHLFRKMQDRNTVRIDSQAVKVLETRPVARCEQPNPWT